MHWKLKSWNKPGLQKSSVWKYRIWFTRSWWLHCMFQKPVSLVGHSGQQTLDTFNCGWVAECFFIVKISNHTMTSWCPKVFPQDLRQSHRNKPSLVATHLYVNSAHWHPNSLNITPWLACMGRSKCKYRKTFSSLQTIEHGIASNWSYQCFEASRK